MCEIEWYAHNAGAQGRVSELVYKPGNYGQHDHETESLQQARMPAQDKNDHNRTLMDLTVVPAHGSLHRDFEAQPDLADAVDAVAALAERTPTYYAYLIVAGSDGFVAPICYPNIKEDAILGITMYNLLVSRRHLLAVLVRSKMCRCGCPSRQKTSGKTTWQNPMCRRSERHSNGGRNGRQHSPKKQDGRTTNHAPGRANTPILVQVLVVCSGGGWVEQSPETRRCVLPVVPNPSSRPQTNGTPPYVCLYIGGWEE